MIFATRGSISWYSGSHAVSSSVTSAVISSESPRIRLSQPCLCSGHEPSTASIAVRSPSSAAAISASRAGSRSESARTAWANSRPGVCRRSSTNAAASVTSGRSTMRPVPKIAQLRVDRRPHAVGEGRARPLEPLAVLGGQLVVLADVGGRS